MAAKVVTVNTVSALADIKLLTFLVNDRVVGANLPPNAAGLR
jgi:hypothetical protein